MRQIGTLANESEVQRLTDYLLTQGIRIEVERGDEGFGIWAIDEDRVPAAREEFNHFRQYPDDPRYAEAQRQAANIRDDLIRKEREGRRNVIDVRRQWTRPRMKPVTFSLVVICCAVAVATRFHEDLDDDPLAQKLSIVSYRVEGNYIKWHGLTQPGSDVRHGEVWRLVTPIFLHIGPWHLLMNMLALQSLGTLIESRRGSWRVALMVLAIAVLSNVAQYAWGGPKFAGISGVVFGLFGYAWMKSEFDPDVGIVIPQSNVMLMLVFLMLCMTGMIGSIANAAHLVGLISGVVIGYWPVARRRIFGR
jgi:GlpG protein